ncbi:hypothetical protein GOODEAATRI_003262 [Goodea atripinnis]|uniref:Uncharacterized protein n=1 Tax=Goodea atripinnis TaxID=208336 RepID=A0ABV0P122_9TELE
MFEVTEGAQGSITSSYTFDPTHQDSVESLAIHGDVFYSSSKDYYIKKWDVASKKLLQGHDSPINGLATNGTQLFTASE